VIWAEKCLTPKLLKKKLKKQKNLSRKVTKKTTTLGHEFWERISRGLRDYYPIQGMVIYER